MSTRQVRRLVKRLKDEGDKVVVHGLRRPSVEPEDGQPDREKIVRISVAGTLPRVRADAGQRVSGQEARVHIGREALRQIMIAAGLWRARGQKVEKVHQWRPRRSCRGELVQWDTSEHDWLEGRGEKLYLIHMIDDATSELTARFVRHDSTEENMRLLWIYLERTWPARGVLHGQGELVSNRAERRTGCEELPRDEREPCRRRRSDGPCGNWGLCGLRPTELCQISPSRKQLHFFVPQQTLSDRQERCATGPTRAESAS